ncbi:hypothetical protein MIR68_012223 [Amoeboaphelidium protococcarum]|nr:hypothetical protein MIR68_012223 [Amoeboaphelidium protococcarum]
MKFMVEDLEVIFPYEYVYPEQVDYMYHLKITLDHHVTGHGAVGHGVLEMPSGTGKTITLLALIVAYQQRLRFRQISGNANCDVNGDVGIFDGPRQLIYASRTVQEIEKALAELDRLILYRASYYQQQLDQATANNLDVKMIEELKVKVQLEQSFLAVGLSARKNMCIHPAVNRDRRGQVVDSLCQSLTASWVRQKDGGRRCTFYENLDKHINPPKDIEDSQTIADYNADAVPSSGVYGIEDIKLHGEKQNVCPYFLSRNLIKKANVLIYSYHYLLDPKIASLVSKDLPSNSIVVFDEAHNIDNVCIDSMSFEIGRSTLAGANRALESLNTEIRSIRQVNKEKLENEYIRLVDGLREQHLQRQTDLILANPALPDDILEEAVPGNIRKAEHFVAFMKRLVEYLKTRLKIQQVVSQSPLSFLHNIKAECAIERKALRFCSERLGSLLRTLEIVPSSNASVQQQQQPSDQGTSGSGGAGRPEDFSALGRVANFATIVGTYLEGFLLLMEPFEGMGNAIYNPILHLVCLDASIAIKPVLNRFKTVIITSGTLSPLDMYPKILDFRHQVVTSKSFSMTLTRNCFLPLVITRGSDQVPLSSKFEVRNDPSVVRNYGNLLISMSKIVPDGIVVFFPSYIYLESIVHQWTQSLAGGQSVIDQLLQNKLVFIETPDGTETTIALQNYRKACDYGRGAILFSVARGKVAEGIDFDHNYGRAVLMCGIPYQYTESRILKARLEYIREKYQIRENDFLTFDAIRQAAQCVGRALRGKTDYGLMIFADKRYARQDKWGKLPLWIQKGATSTQLGITGRGGKSGGGGLVGASSASLIGLSTDECIMIVKKFLREMGQELGSAGQVGVSLWREEDVVKWFSCGHATIENSNSTQSQQQKEDQDALMDDIDPDVLNDMDYEM